MSYQYSHCFTIDHNHIVVIRYLWVPTFHIEHLDRSFTTAYKSNPQPLQTQVRPLRLHTNNHCALRESEKIWRVGNSKTGFDRRSVHTISYLATACTWMGFLLYRSCILPTPSVYVASCVKCRNFNIIQRRVQHCKPLIAGDFVKYQYQCRSHSAAVGI